MSTEAPVPAKAASNKYMIWSGRGLSGLLVLALTMSALFKFQQPKEFVVEFTKFGYDIKSASGIGVVEIVSTILYAIPQTAVLGAILLTGYLGGAVATHVRINDPYVGPVILGVLVWVGLFLRDARLRAILPFRW